MSDGELRCPHCHMRVALHEIITLARRQRAIIEAVDTYKKRNGHKLPSSRQIAAEIDRNIDLGILSNDLPHSVSTIQKELAYLEAIHIVSRPNGAYKGYDRKLENMVLTKAA